MNVFDSIRFANPAFFWLFIPLAALVLWHVLKCLKKYPTVKLSTIGVLPEVGKTLKVRLRHLPFILTSMALALVIVALARPQSEDNWETVDTEGIDIMMAIDISSSMLAQDFTPNRLEAAKDIAAQFINSRPNDRVGLVVFSAESFTQCPITSDHSVLLNLFADIKSGMVEDGTAIGLGLANAVNRIKDSEAVSKVIILLTDGMNNTGSVSPQTAADIAQTFGIRVYTVGVGSLGTAPYPVQTPLGIRYQNMETQIDEEILQQIASKTGGRYFRATDNKTLESVYDEIDSLERTIVSVQSHRNRQDIYLPVLILAALLIVIARLLRYTYFKVLP